MIDKHLFLQVKWHPKHRYRICLHNHNGVGAERKRKKSHTLSQVSSTVQSCGNAHPSLIGGIGTVHASFHLCNCMLHSCQLSRLLWSPVPLVFSHSPPIFCLFLFMTSLYPFALVPTLSFSLNSSSSSLTFIPLRCLRRIIISLLSLCFVRQVEHFVVSSHMTGSPSSWMAPQPSLAAFLFCSCCSSARRGWLVLKMMFQIMPQQSPKKWH